MRAWLSIPLFLLTVGDYAGEPRLALPGQNSLSVRAVDLFPADPARRWIGALEYLGGIELIEKGGGVGGYSAIDVHGDRFTLLSDGGIILTFRWGGIGRPVHDARWRALPAGPGRGWAKADRDSESMVIDRSAGAAWVGFEDSNQVWRYDVGLRRATGHAAPRAMAAWPENGGAETLARMPGGGMLAISEKMRPIGRPGRRGVYFSGDPVSGPERTFAFTYLPPAGMDPVDGVALPDGRLLVLNRSFALPYQFASVLTLIDAGAIRPGAVVRGRMVATLDSPALHDNFEGVAVTREGERTIVWLVSDDNQSVLQRTLLLKFALAE
jgi:hypothetical protein